MDLIKAFMASSVSVTAGVNIRDVDILLSELNDSLRSPGCQDLPRYSLTVRIQRLVGETWHQCIFNS